MKPASSFSTFSRGIRNFRLAFDLSCRTYPMLVGVALASWASVGCDSSTTQASASPSTLPASAAIVALRRPNNDIDLDYVSQFEQLRLSNPEHYRKIKEILAGIQTRDPSVAVEWMKVSYDAKGVTLDNIFLVSLPPKRILSFELNGTRYRATVVNPGSVRPGVAEVKR